MRAPLVACVIGLAAPGCDRTPSSPRPQVEYAARYSSLLGGVNSEADAARVRRELPYGHIELTVLTPVWPEIETIDLRRDGTISMSGSGKPRRNGTVSLSDYVGLCFLIERSGFEALNSKYAWNGFDAMTYTVK